MYSDNDSFGKSVLGFLASVAVMFIAGFVIALVVIALTGGLELGIRWLAHAHIPHHDALILAYLLVAAIETAGMLLFFVLFCMLFQGGGSANLSVVLILQVLLSIVIGFAVPFWV